MKPSVLEPFEKSSNNCYIRRNVTPAKAGIQLTRCKKRWIPAGAGTTGLRNLSKQTFSTRLLGMSIFFFVFFQNSVAVLAQAEAALEPDAIIQKILEVEAKQRSEIQSVSFDAEYIEKESNGQGGYDEKVKLEKKIRLKYLPDTVWYNEEYLRYFKNGEVRSRAECDEMAAQRQDKKKRRGSRDISYPILTPFKPENRAGYDIAYAGVDDSTVASYVCHHFKVTSTTADEDKINGDYYFEAASFQLARVIFWPAKLSGNLMFKLDKMEMSLSYAPTAQGHWLPEQFDISGRGKAAFFIDVDWSGTEYFHNPQINSGMSDDIFKSDQD